ncbi:MAG: hypothetical protein FDW93_04755 [Bergeyella sp.]|nr:hypothetical protein [Bergeyella sp.]
MKSEKLSLIKIRAFNCKKKTIEILNRNPTMDISLSPEVAEIREVSPKNMTDYQKRRHYIPYKDRISIIMDGKDLMEGAYGVINKSSSLNALSKMEVMENHQTIKAPQNKMLGEQFAINIKLKKLVTLLQESRDMEIDSTPLPLRIQNSLPVIFGKKWKGIVSDKINNTGDAVENEGNILFLGEHLRKAEKYSPKYPWLDK